MNTMPLSPSVFIPVFGALLALSVCCLVLWPRIKGWFISTVTIDIPQDSSCPIATVDHRTVDLSFNPAWPHRDVTVVESVVTGIVSEVFIATGVRLPHNRVREALLLGLRRWIARRVLNETPARDRKFPRRAPEPITTTPVPEPVDMTVTNMLVMNAIITDGEERPHVPPVTHDATPIATHTVEPIATHDSSSSSCDGGSCSAD